MNRSIKNAPGAVLAVAMMILALALPVFPERGDAQEVEVTDVMERMNKAYSGLINSIMAVPVQELASDTPYGDIVKWAREMESISVQLPATGELKGDGAVLVLSRQLGGLAARLGKLAEAKKTEEMGGVLVDIRRMCLRCHADYRF